MATPLPPPDPFGQAAASGDTGSAAQRSVPSTGSVLVLVGAVVAAVSVFLPWGTADLFDESRNALKVPTQLLWDTTPASLDSFAVGWLVLVGAALAVLGALRPAARTFSLLGSALSLAMALLWVNAVRAILDDPLYNIEASISDGVGAGTWPCVVGSSVGVVGAILLLRRRTSPNAPPSVEG